MKSPARWTSLDDDKSTGTGRKQYVEMNGLSSGTEGKPSSSYRLAFCVELVTYSYNNLKVGTL